MVSKEMDAEIFEVMKQVLMKNEYMSLLGIEVLKIRRGYCRGRIRVSGKIMNPYGFLHRGSLYSLADIIGGTAACTYGNFVTTVSGSMNFLIPANKTEYVYCEANVVRQGGHLGVYDLKLFAEDGTVLENASFTYYITDKQVLQWKKENACNIDKENAGNTDKENAGNMDKGV